MRLGNKSIFIGLDFSCSREEAIKILKEFGILKQERGEKRRGRPRGTYVYNDEMIYKVPDFVREKKIVSIRQIKDSIGWNWQTTQKISYNPLAKCESQSHIFFLYFPF